MKAVLSSGNINTNRVFGLTHKSVFSLAFGILKISCLSVLTTICPLKQNNKKC